MKRRKQENYWQSISDLMTGLMVIFLFVCLAFIYQMKEVQNQFNMERIKIYEDLQKEFKPEEIAKWGTKIDDKTLSVHFIEPTVFFANNDASVTPAFKEVLKEFFPRYVKVLRKYGDSIVEIRIEGNASKEWNGDANSNQAYYYNMKLSQDRAFNVLQYVYAIDGVKKDKLWLQEKLRANGASYSNAKVDNANASRCVEINIRRNAENVIDNMKDLFNLDMKAVDDDVKKAE